MEVKNSTRVTQNYIVVILWQIRKPVKSAEFHSKSGGFHSKSITNFTEKVFHQNSLWISLIPSAICHSHIKFNTKQKTTCRCNRKSIPPGKTTPPITLMHDHLKIIAPGKLYFCRGILPNFLHFVLKLQF